MNELEKFLSRATRGLWGKQKQDLRLELESHIRERAKRYQVSGSNEQESISLAIQDLGDAKHIAAGMRDVYTIPNGFRMVAITGIATVATVLSLQFVRAQEVVGTTLIPIADCLSGKISTINVGNGEQLPCNIGGYSISLTSLRATLESLGVKIEERENVFIISWPEAFHTSRFNYFPQTLAFRNSKGDQITLTKDKDYIFLSEFISGLQTDFAVNRPNIGISGWDNPKLTVGKISFGLGSAMQPVKGGIVYGDLLRLPLENYFVKTPNTELFIYSADMNLSNIQGISKTPSMYKHKIYTGFSENDIAVVLNNQPAYSFTMYGKELKIEKSQNAFIAPVTKDGSIEYISVYKTINPTTTNNLSYGQLGSAGTISVVKFTGNLGSNGNNNFETLNPENIRVEPVK